MNLIYNSSNIYNNNYNLINLIHINSWKNKYKDWYNYGMKNEKQVTFHFHHYMSTFWSIAGLLQNCQNTLTWLWPLSHYLGKGKESRRFQFQISKIFI